MTLSRRIAAETLGTAFLLAAVVGSGIMGEKLAGGNVAIALLANTLATGAMLVTLIFTFGPISGAHFNPAVTLADASQGGIGWGDVPAYILGQVFGAFIGLEAAHLMFGEALLQVSQHARAGARSFSANLSPPSGCCLSFGAVVVCIPKPSPWQSVFTYQRLLVYGFHVLCQSGGNARTSLHKYICRDSTERCTGLHRGTGPWRFCCDRSFSLACTSTSRRTERGYISACSCWT
jgi:major intrinsic protein